MADFSAIPESDVRALEEAMVLFGVDGVTVDGNAEDLEVPSVRLLDSLSRALGEDGLSWGEGAQFQAADFTNPATRQEKLQQIESAVTAFRQSPQLQLLAEIVKGQDADFDAIERHLTALRDMALEADPEADVSDPAEQAATIRGYLDKPDSDIGSVLNGIPGIGGVLDVAGEHEGFRNLREILSLDLLNGDAFWEGDQTRQIQQIRQTIAVLDSADTMFATLRSIGTAAYPEVDSAAEAEASAESLQVRMEEEDTAAAEAEATRVQAVQEATRAVEAVIGVEAPNGEWGAVDQQKLRDYIRSLQEADSYWMGHDNGIYHGAFSDYVAEHPDRFTSAQKAFFVQLDFLQTNDVELYDVDPAAGAIMTEGSIADAARIVEQGLATLIPAVQSRLDDKRAEVDELLDNIQGGGDGIGRFVDEFLLGTVPGSTLGRRVVNTGKEWASNAVRSQIAGVYDIPEPGNLTDGYLSIQDQAALQGVVFLMAKNFNIPIRDKWQYTPEMGEQLQNAIASRLSEDASFEQKEEFILSFMTEEEREEYDALDDAQKRLTIEERARESDAELTALLTSLNTLYNAGALHSERLYFVVAASIPEVTQDIFEDYITDHASNPAVLNMLGGLVHVSTQSFNLPDVVGTDFVLPDGVEMPDPSQTIAQNMAGLYDDFVANGGNTGDVDDMLAIVNMLPFGSVERREAFAQAVRDAFTAAQTPGEAGTPANAFGLALQASMEELADQDGMGATYTTFRNRPVSMDPRMQSIDLGGGQVVTPEEIFAAYAQRNEGMELGSPQRDIERTGHKPVYFTDADGQVYVGAVDLVSRVFRYEKLNLDGIDAIARDVRREHGEPGYAYEERLLEAFGELPDNEGFSLIYQRWDWGNGMGEGKWTLANSYLNLKHDVSEVIQPLSALASDAEAGEGGPRAEFDAAVSGAGGEAEVVEADADTVDPDSVCAAFGGVAVGEFEGSSGPDDGFRATADELCRAPDGSLFTPDVAHVPGAGNTQ